MPVTPLPGVLLSDDEQFEGEVKAIRMAVDYVNSLETVLPDTNLSVLINQTKHPLTTFHSIRKSNVTSLFLYVTEKNKC